MTSQDSGNYVALPWVERAGDPLAFITVGSVCISLATIAVALRIYTKWRIVGKIRADDWFMMFSLVLLGVYCAVVIVGGTVARPNGKPLQAKELALSVNLLNQGELFYLLTIMFLKISIGLFFLQIVQHPKMRFLIYLTVTTSTVFGIATFFFAIFQCGIYSDTWDFIAKRFGNRCVSDAAALGMTFTHGALTVITDWTFLIMPFFILRKTMMARREKMAIGFVLAFGSISGIAAIARLPYITILAVPKFKIFDQIQNIAIWSAVEPAVGIIAGSLVTIRPLFRKIFPNVSRNKGSSPKDVPSLATIATTTVAHEDDTHHDKLEAFYDSFGSSRPMTPQSYSKGDLEMGMGMGRRPSDAATLVESPRKLRGQLNQDFQFPFPGPHQAADQTEVKDMAKQPKRKLAKQTFLLDQTIDEPEKDVPGLEAPKAAAKNPHASMWTPPNWEVRAESPRRVAKPLLPTPAATISSQSYPSTDKLPTLEEKPKIAQLPVTSRFQYIKPNPQEWELRDWDRRAQPIAPAPEAWHDEEVLHVSQQARVMRPKETMLKRHLSSKAQQQQKVFGNRGNSVMEPGLPLDLFFGGGSSTNGDRGAGDDMSDTASTVSRQPSRHVKDYS